MKTFLAATLLLGVALVASLPRKTCYHYQGDHLGYRVQVDTVAKWGKTTSFVVLYPKEDSLPTIMGSYEGGQCEFFTLSNPYLFAAEPATSKDPSIREVFRVMGRARIAVAVDENIVHPTVVPFWVKFVPLKFL